MTLWVSNGWTHIQQEHQLSAAIVPKETLAATSSLHSLYDAESQRKVVAQSGFPKFTVCKKNRLKLTDYPMSKNVQYMHPSIQDACVVFSPLMV